MKRLFVILFFGLSFASCDKEEGWNCTKKSGENVLDARAVDSFSRIKATGKMDVTYRYAETSSVEVIFGKNVVADITTHVENGQLYIENQTSCNWVRNQSKVPQVIVYAPTLEFFENRTAGDIFFEDTLRSEFFHFDQWDANGVVNLKVVAEELDVFIHTGYCELKVAGTASIAQLYSASVCTYDASELYTSSCLVNNSSTYDITCHSNGYLFGLINSSGDIVYSGSPVEIDTDIQGNGSVRPQ